MKRIETVETAARMLVGYARVSTADQSLRMQIDALRKAGIPDELIFAEKMSGADERRPQFRRALKMLRPGWTLCVWKLNRAARSMSHLLRISEEIRDKGCHLRSLTENFDTSTAMGTLVFHILATLAQFERDLTRERTKAGMQALRDAGAKVGRERKLATPEKLAAVEADLRDLSMTVIEVAKKHGISQPALHRYFPAYRTRNLGKGAQGLHWKAKRDAAAKRRKKQKP